MNSRRRLLFTPTTSANPQPSPVNLPESAVTQKQLCNRFRMNTYRTPPNTHKTRCFKSCACNSCADQVRNPFEMNRCTKHGGWGRGCGKPGRVTFRRRLAPPILRPEFRASSFEFRASRFDQRNFTVNCQLLTVNSLRAPSLYFFPYRCASRIFLRPAASRYRRFSSAVLGMSGGIGLGCPVTSSMATNVA